MNLEQQLHAALTPCEPGPQPLAMVMARISAAQARRGPQRSTSKLVLLGSFLVVAAAASMLVLRQTPAPSARDAAPVGLDSPAPLVTGDETPAAVPAQIVQEAVSPPVEEQRGPETLISQVKPFTVRLLSLRNNATNTSAKRAINDFHAALVEGLRAVPGLVLVTEDSADFAADATTDFRLAFRGTDLPIDKYEVRLDAESFAPRVVLPIVIGGYIAPACTGTGAPDCGDPSSMAASVLQLLRKSVFPSDPAVTQELRTLILDTSLSASDRLNALLQSIVPRVARPGVEGPKNLLEDPQIVRSLADLAATASDPVIRARVWIAIRNRNATGFIPWLADALRLDSDGKVRLEAATTLATNFATDPQARAALEAAAQQDPVPAVRAVARRGILGETAWLEYAVSSVKDTSLTPEARIEALLIMANQPGRAPDLGRLLTDHEAIEAFADAFSRVQASTGLEGPNMVLLGRMDSIYHPAITGLLLDSLERAVQPSTRQSIVGQLSRRSADERVQAVLRKLSVEDADPELRKMALQAIRSSAAAIIR